MSCEEILHNRCVRAYKLNQFTSKLSQTENTSYRRINLEKLVLSKHGHNLAIARSLQCDVTLG